MGSSMNARPQLTMSPPKETCSGYKIVSRVNCFDENEGGVLKSVLVFIVAEDTKSGERIIFFGSFLLDSLCVHAQ